MSYQTITYEVRDSVLTLTLNRPERLNAIDMVLAQELKSAFSDAASDSSVRAIILTGSGRAFSSGGDIKAMAANIDSGPELFFGEPLSAIHDVVLAIRQIPKPVIAAINGVASGAGCNIALACDLRIAAQSARFNQAFVKIGLTPDGGGSFILPRLVGWSKATELMMTGEIIDGREAAAIGMVNRAVPDSELWSVVWQMATELANGPTAAYGRIKQLMDRSATLSYAEQLNYEQETQLASGHTSDFVEGIKAFTERRKAVFKGS
jgi:2-(1,2-epoxy-1,2-dihydrophenyl)acetyl-CoA isomerase